MPDITEQSINEKLEKNETLTAEETKFVMSMPPAEGNVAEVDEEEDDPVDFTGATDVDKKADKSVDKSEEDKKAEEEKKAAEDKKKEEDDATVAKKKQEEEDEKDPFLKIERELAKPPNEANLVGFTVREKAYFHQMQRDKKSRQEAEEQRDAALFRETKRKKKEETDKKSEEDKAEDDPLAILKDREPDEYPTVKEFSEVIKKTLAVKEKQKAEPEDDDSGKVKPDLVKMRFIKMCDDEARSAHADDYEEVMELADELINTNKDHLVAVQEAIGRGENPAEISYQLIKKDPEFSKLFPAAQTRVKARRSIDDSKKSKSIEDLKKEEEAKKAQEALEKNKNKTKTTGHAGGEGGGDEGDVIDGYSVDEIMKMSDLDFAKNIPKATRDKFLKQYG